MYCALHIFLSVRRIQVNFGGGKWGGGVVLVFYITLLVPFLQAPNFGNLEQEYFARTNFRDFAKK